MTDSTDYSKWRINGYKSGSWVCMIDHNIGFTHKSVAIEHMRSIHKFSSRAIIRMREM